MTDNSATSRTTPGTAATLLAAGPVAAGSVTAGRSRRVPAPRRTHLTWRPIDGERVAVVSRARNWLGRSLPRLVGHSPRRDLHDDAELLLSELVTNAVLHAGGVTTVGLRLAGKVLRVTVCDHAVVRPTAQDAAPGDEHGRGIALVEALATRWGVEPERSATGKCVWLELCTAAAGT